MKWGGHSFMFVALCCLHVDSESLHGVENYNDRIVRTGENGSKDGLALSKELFRNITKQLRDNIKGPNDKNTRLKITKTEDGRTHGQYQSYHHHEHHWGPYFENNEISDTEEAMQVAAHVGSEALINCRVGMLKDKTVMWLRRNTDSAQLLTVGPAPYAGDSRIAVKFQYPNNWRLSVNPVRKTDAGVYMCQISTHPPRAILANLTVLAPVLTINGDITHELRDRFYKSGSSISLICKVSDDYIEIAPSKPTTTTEPIPTSTTVEATTKSTINTRINLLLNQSWSIETTTVTTTVRFSTTKLTSTTQMPAVLEPQVNNNIFGLEWRKQGQVLVEGISWMNMSATYHIVSASQNDSGTYTCHLRNHSQAFVNVHVLISENQAAVQHDTWNKGSFFCKSNLKLALYLPFVTSFALTKYLL